MNIRIPLTAAMMAIVLLSATGCAVTRGQETVGAYIDDTTITTQVKARFVDNTEVDALVQDVDRFFDEGADRVATILVSR